MGVLVWSNLVWVRWSAKIIYSPFWSLEFHKNRYQFCRYYQISYLEPARQLRIESNNLRNWRFPYISKSHRKGWDGMGFTQISMVNAIANFIFPKCPQQFLLYSVYLCQKLITFSLEHYKLSQLAKEWLLIKYNSMTQTNILQIHIRIHPTRKFSKYIYITISSFIVVIKSQR